MAPCLPLILSLKYPSITVSMVTIAISIYCIHGYCHYKSVILLSAFSVSMVTNARLFFSMTCDGFPG